MIIFEDVYFKYPYLDSYILKNINIEIGEGEILAIMGDNGAGKTTLVKHMNGLLKPSRGNVFVDGENTREVHVSELSKKVALVFQYPEKMFFSERVWDEVAFALRNFGYNPDMVVKLVEKALKLFWLWRYRDISPYMLSGGEQRRLALASVIGWDPKYIILDEPTAGQDAIQRELLLNIIDIMRKKGKTVVLVSHDVEFIAELSPRVILMSKGEILYDGEARRLFRNRELLMEAGLIQPYLYSLESRLIEKGLVSRRFRDFNDFINILEDIWEGRKI